VTATGGAEVCAAAVHATQSAPTRIQHVPTDFKTDLQLTEIFLIPYPFFLPTAPADSPLAPSPASVFNLAGSFS